MAAPEVGLDPRTSADHLPPPWGSGLKLGHVPAFDPASVPPPAQPAADLICPVCGHVALRRQCTIVCGSCHTLIMRCSE